MQLKAIQNFHKTGKTETKNRKDSAVNFHYERKKSNHTQHHRMGTIRHMLQQQKSVETDKRNLGKKLSKKIPQKIISWSIFHVI